MSIGKQNAGQAGEQEHSVRSQKKRSGTEYVMSVGVHVGAEQVEPFIHNDWYVVRLAELLYHNRMVVRTIKHLGCSKEHT